jgi:hypothetical protein
MQLQLLNCILAFNNKNLNSVLAFNMPVTVSLQFLPGFIFPNHRSVLNVAKDLKRNNK